MTQSDNLKRLVPAEKARQIVLDNVAPTEPETIGLAEAAYRVLATDVKARRTQPPFAASSMDGYAVRQDDLQELPVELSQIGEAAAGHPFNGEVKPGTTVRIFTGGVLPKGTDTIIIQENTEANGKSITVLEASPTGKFIRKAGMDFQEGDVLLKAGETLSPVRLALAASMNHASITVYRKPKIAIIATGDELVLPGEHLAEGQIIASNSFGIAAFLRNLGATVLDLGIVKDTLPALEASIEKAISAGCDLIITMGGASVGDHDLVMPAFKEAGFEFKLAKIKMRPGKPFLFAEKKTDQKIVRMVGLAGNPVSSMVAAHVFVKPLIQKMSGLPPERLKRKAGVLRSNLPENDGREDYMRAVAEPGDNGQTLITPFDSQDSSQLRLLSQANCLLIRAPNAPAAQHGTPCEYIDFDE